MPNITTSTGNIINEIFCTLFSYEVFEIKFLFLYTWICSAFQLRLVTVQVLNSHVWLMTIVLASAEPENDWRSFSVKVALDLTP